jgi:DNA-binding transcriptional ArsR family regulator
MVMEIKMANQAPDVVDDLVKALDSKVIKALTEPARAQILKYLMLNGRSDISTIAEALPQDRSVISRHLNMLAAAGIVIAEKETRHRYYIINGAAFLNEFEAIVTNIRKCMTECCPESL